MGFVGHKHRHWHPITGLDSVVALVAFLAVASGCPFHGNAPKASDFGLSNEGPRTHITQLVIKGTFAEGAPLVRHTGSLMPFFTAEELVDLLEAHRFRRYSIALGQHTHPTFARGASWLTSLTTT